MDELRVELSNAGFQIPNTESLRFFFSSTEIN
jgi:hypothetical protein